MSLGRDIASLRFGDLDTFLSVQRHGSVTRAARELRVTPSQVSKAVGRVEEQLGLKLLSRGARGVTLTDTARRVLPELEEVTRRLRRLPRGAALPSRELTIAAPSYLGAAMIPRLARDVAKVRFRGLELPPAAVRAYAGENLFDAALVVGEARLPESWVGTFVGELRKSLFATPDLARKLGKPPIQVDKLRDVPFISPIYTANGQFLPADDGCPLPYSQRKVGHEVETIGLALEIASHCHQLVFGPVIAARRHVERGALVELSIRGWNLRESLFVYCNRDRVIAPLQRKIVEALKLATSEIGGGKA